MTIEGIPEGWVALKFDHSAFGDNWIDEMGQIHSHEADLHSKYKRLIIRKIEKPKQYRAFANMEEAEPWFDEVLRWKDGSKAIFRVSAMGNTHVVIGFNQYTYQEAFSKFVNQHGSPFGVEVAS